MYAFLRTSTQYIKKSTFKNSLKGKINLLLLVLLLKRIIFFVQNNMILMFNKKL